MSSNFKKALIALSGIPLFLIYIWIISLSGNTPTLENKWAGALYLVGAIILLIIFPRVLSLILNHKQFQVSDSSTSPAQDHVVYAKVILWLILALFAFGPALIISISSLLN